MAEELKEFSEEEELQRKIRQKKRIRGCLIVANALLLCYFAYLLGDTVAKKIIEKRQVINSEIIQLNGKSSGKSKQIYEKYISSSIDVNDIALYGKYLLTSSSRVQYDDLNYESDVWLINLLSNPFVVENNLRKTLGDKIDEQIDLFDLEVGDYMMCKSFKTSDNKGICYHYTGEELLEETIYSFPDENNHRKKISVKGKGSSPAIVVSVEAINLLPKNHYDFVVIGKEEKFDIFKNTKYQVKYVDTLKEAYQVNASYAINVLDIEGIYTSNYVSAETLKPGLIESTSVYNKLDEDNVIRELGGYVFNAGYGVKESETTKEISNASLDIKSLNNELRSGKYTLCVNENTTLKEIVDIIK